MIKPLRVFLLEDHPATRLGLKTMLEERGFVVCGEAEKIEQALALLPSAKADVAVFDLSLQGKTALSAISDFRNRFRKLAIIVYSMHDSVFFIESALQAGADGYVTKVDPVEALITAIGEVRKGKIHFGPSLAKDLEKKSYDPGNSGKKIREISGRELEVLTLLGQGFGQSEIAERLFLSPRTVETHLNRIREKLGVKSSRELIRAAIQFHRPG